MSSATLSGITATLPLFSNGKLSDSSPSEKLTSSPMVGTAVTKENKPINADTVSISPQLQQTIDDIKKEDVIPPDTSKTINKEKSAGAMTQVQFAYDMKGDLSIRYVDSADRLIYQVPSELMMRIKEAASKLDSSVNTNA